MAIPFSIFEGYIKQLNVAELDDNEHFALDSLFPLFCNLDDWHRFDSGWCPVRTGMNGKVFYVGRGRERRYAGDQTLTRGRYFSLCNNTASGDDGGTLLNELMAYYSYRSRIPGRVFDTTVGHDAAKELRTYGHELPHFPALLLRVGPKESNPVPKRMGLPPCDTVHVPLPLIILRATIEYTVDLRIPATQDWFFSHFMELEQAHCRYPKENGIFKSGDTYFVTFDKDRSEMRSFVDILPVLLAPEPGGGQPFLQGVGAWLRSHGANALIYPSARRNTSVTACARTGQVLSSAGWNLVVFAGSPGVDWRNHFGHMISWEPYLGEAVRIEVFDGSGGLRGFAVSGVEERNLVRFRRGLQLAAGDGDLGLLDMASGAFSILDIDPAIMRSEKA